ncbi:LRR receptor-like serine/threonine-protein kinase EFR [Vitis vinifera]|uniref:LRR receptor-like serine/threonine-protein kinase EFR n=1 Tax=Vitis vinifera TaxID=29760 RepID=A0A438GM07_VITVI|nr:LRR receptor-like serine/threonine-protein kinase EFR [Vitis vinifera]
MEIPSFSLRLQWWYFLVNLIICISLLRLESLSSTPTFGNETDKLALLTIKHYLVDVPNGVLSSWNDSLHFCQWQGVTCSGRRQRVTTLRELVLSNNHLHCLNLSTNSLQGEIPVELTNCSNLRTMDLTRNNLTGQIPFHFGHISKLLILRLGRNSLTGVIPFTLGNLSSLQQLSVAFNHLEGYST